LILAWFEPIPDTPENLFPIDEPAQPKTDTYPMLTLGEIINRPPPSFLVARHIPEVGVGFSTACPAPASRS
jgi:hypothetical protein